MDSLMSCAVQNTLNPGFSQKMLHRQLSLNNIDTEEKCCDFQASSFANSHNILALLLSI